MHNQYKQGYTVLYRRPTCSEFQHNQAIHWIFFFFQAEDGIRDLTVTGVQTCALPISDDRILTLALDRSGTLWVGTEVGLDRWQPEHRAFIHFRHEAGNLRSLSGNQVSRLLEDHSGTLWIGTFDAGLDRMDRDGRVTQVFRHDAAQAASLANDDVRALLEDQAGHLWVGTAAGLDMLNRATGQFSHYRHDPSDAGSLRDSFIMSLYHVATGLGGNRTAAAR